jgi:hypothetical protein
MRKQANEHQIRKTSRYTTVNRTFRIESGSDGKLEVLSREQNIPINFLVNKAIKRFVDWEVHAERFRFLSVSPSTQAKLMGYLTEGQARELGKWWAENAIIGLIVFWFKKFDFDTLMQAIELLGSEYGRIFTHKFSVDDDGTYTIVLRHERGLKTSYFYEEAAKSLLTRLGLKNMKTSTTEDQVTINVPNKPTPEAKP